MKTDKKSIGMVEAGVGGTILFATIFTNFFAIVYVGFGQMAMVESLQLLALAVGIAAVSGFMVFDGFKRMG
ncbi:hypothetical protein ACFLQ2_05200 [archaeon]